MICDICGKDVSSYCICLSCDSKFCKNCGDLKREKCNYCLQYEESQDSNEDSWED